MNETSHTVTEIKSKPYKSYTFWCVDVLADSWGSIQDTIIHCKTEDEANNVKIGYEFDA
jgi:hypothetical protein